LPEESNDSKSKRYVCSHGDTPSRRSLSGRIEGEIDEGRNDHPPESRQNRQSRRPRITEITQSDRAFDLESNHEEEEGHQCVIHQLPERFPDLEDRSSCDLDLRVPEVVVGVTEGIGPHHGSCGGDQENDP